MRPKTSNNFSIHTGHRDYNNLFFLHRLKSITGTFFQCYLAERNRRNHAICRKTPKNGHYNK